MAEAAKDDPALAAAHDYEANRAALHGGEATKTSHDPSAPVLEREPVIDPPVTEGNHHEAVLVGDEEEGGSRSCCGNCGLDACPTIPFESIAKLSVWFLLMGMSLLLMGIVALAAPSLLKMAVEYLLGATLTFSALFAIIHGVYTFDAQGSSVSILYAVVYLLLGLFLIALVVSGLSEVLQICLAAWLVIGGISKLILAAQLRHMAASPIVLISGIVSLSFFQVAVTRWHHDTRDRDKVFGIIIGAELLSNGVASSCVALTALCSTRVHHNLGTDPRRGSEEDLHRPILH
eukprot:TRINITY_DN5400_c0_g2_i1.p1 TRINITY_DN5400_c0_g2~~TRINITY_DN5400_c0_g2_i1.p1  ORF type:complete len:290 (-),score=72.55 TRINITY_DN5400_c0_g2_i1:23-892(-)